MAARNAYPLVRQRVRNEQALRHIIGDKTLRATYGDVAAMTIVAVIAGIIVIVTAIGAIRGWVRW